jgi:hypothetical protein
MILYGGLFYIEWEMKTMAVASVSSARVNMKQNQVQSAAQTRVLRNSMAEKEQAAQKIVQSVPQQSQTVLNPSYLGRNIDTKA